MLARVVGYEDKKLITVFANSAVVLFADCPVCNQVQ